VSDSDLITEAVRAANADEEVVEEEGYVEEVAEVEEEPRVFAGKYSTPDDLENAYLELQRKFHESRQPEEEQQQEEPAKQFFGVDPQSQAELVTFAEQDPTQAAMWVMQNQTNVPSDLANAVLEHWWTQKPWEATQYYMDQRMSLEREEMAGMTMPLVEQHERAIMAEAYDHLVANIPDYDEYQDRVEQFIDTHDVSGIINIGSENDPVALSDGLGTIVGILKWQEYQEAMRNQGMLVPTQEIPNGSQVSTRNTTTDIGSDSSDMDEMIRAMILNA
jgi:hypothetical protein